MRSLKVYPIHFIVANIGVYIVPIRGQSWFEYYLNVLYQCR